MNGFPETRLADRGWEYLPDPGKWHVIRGEGFKVRTAWGHVEMRWGSERLQELGCGGWASIQTSVCPDWKKRAWEDTGSDIYKWSTCQGAMFTGGTNSSGPK